MTRLDLTEHEYYRNLVEQAVDGIFIADGDGRYLRVNESGARMLGMTPEEVVGLSITDVLVPEEIARVAPALERLHAGEALEGDWRFRRKDGSTFDGEVTAKLLSDGRIQGIARDVSARKAVERELRQSEERFRTLASAALEGIGVFEDGRLVDMNEQLGTLFGATRAELLQVPTVELFPPEQHELVRAMVFGGHEAPFATEVRRKDGRNVAVEMCVRTIERDGRTVRLAAIRDMSESRAAETERTRITSALHASLESLRATIDTTPYVAVQWYDAQGRVQLWNRASERMFGWSAREALGRTLDQLIHTPDEAEAFVRMLGEIERSGKPAGPSEFAFRRRNGSEGFCLSTTFQIPGEGDGTRFVCMDVDVTDQRRSEAKQRETAERFRLLIDNSSDLVCEVDQDGKVLYVNTRFETLLGYAPEELTGHDLLRHAHPDDVDGAREQFKRAQPTATFRHRHKRGHYVWLEATSRDYRTSLGESRSVVIARDVGERLRAEEERAAIEERLRHAQKLDALGTLAGGVAHDFNNILGAIFAYSELAQMDAGDGERVRAHLEQLDKAGRRAADLVKQILTFSRKQSHERRPTALPPVLDEALRFVRSTLPATIQLQIDVDRQVPPVLSSAVQLQQVIMNLCTNAGHAMRAAPGTLAVRLESVMLDAEAVRRQPDLNAGRYVRLTVRDSGHGMDAQTLDRIFEPFFTTKGAGEGTGLGLSVVHGIVREHQGALRVESELGKGTTFEVYLPAHELAGVAVEESLQALPRARGERILFVDDERALCEASSAILERVGYQVTTSCDPFAALSAFQLGPDQFDLILVDLSMPGMTGVELARRVLALRPGMPIVLASGFAGQLSAEQARELGIRAVIEKPMTPAALTAIVQRALGLPAAGPAQVSAGGA